MTRAAIRGHRDLLHPYDAARMKMMPANPAVGN
jgi:hypothetical protein